MDKMDTQQLIRHIHRSDLTALEKRYLEGLVEARTPKDGMRLINADALDGFEIDREKTVVVVNPEVDNEAAIECFDQYADGWNEAIAYIKAEAETIEAEPVRHGRWNFTSCSLCGKSFLDYAEADCDRSIYLELPNYCPNCGAKMRKENENE